MKRLLPWLALLTLAAPAQPPQKIVIGAWNIEHLGDPARRSGPSRDVAQQPEDLARYIGESGADILALEEIGDNPNTEFDPDNATLAKALALLSKDWKYILFPKKGDELTQLTGIAWNSAKVSAVDGPYILPINDRTGDGFQLWKRWPQAMKFRVAQDHTDFVLIPMHLKANRRDDPNDNPARQRAQETRALVKVLGSVRQRFHEQDVVLLGDTNCLKAGEPALRNLNRAGYRDLNAKDVRTTWEGPAPFDRILVPRRQPEFRNSTETVHRPAGMEPKDFKIKYSDHYLVTTEMQVGPDDD